MTERIGGGINISGCDGLCLRTWCLRLLLLRLKAYVCLVFQIRPSDCRPKYYKYGFHPYVCSGVVFCITYTALKIVSHSTEILVLIISFSSSSLSSVLLSLFTCVACCMWYFVLSISYLASTVMHFVFGFCLWFCLVFIISCVRIFSAFLYAFFWLLHDFNSWSFIPYSCPCISSFQVLVTWFHSLVPVRRENSRITWTANYELLTPSLVQMGLLSGWCYPSRIIYRWSGNVEELFVVRWEGSVSLVSQST